MNSNELVTFDDLSDEKIKAGQKLVLAILFTCILMAGLGIFLFADGFYLYGILLGINVVVFAIIVVLSWYLLKKLARHTFSLSSYVVAASSLFFTFTFVWRDSSVLNVLSLIALIMLLILGFSLKTRKKLQTIDSTELMYDVTAAISYASNSYYQLLSKDIHWHEVRYLKQKYGRSVYRGILLTIPLFCLFALLLISSDARFEQSVYSLFDWGLKWPKIINNSVIFIVISLITAAILRASVLRQGLKAPKMSNSSPRWKLGLIEMLILLGSINILFFSFILVQFSYFFGGDALVQSSDGLSYATYARSGFFQLVIVAILVLILLLFAHWSYRTLVVPQNKIFTWLAIIMLMLTMSIEFSAAHRMSLYTDVYGLTELRFYTSVFMAWLLILFSWFSATVLRGKRKYFSFGALLSAMIFIAILHIINPDAIIAETNIMRLQKGKTVDAIYLSSLSTDAVPALFATLNRVEKSKNICKSIWSKMQYHKLITMEQDWRYYNYSRYQAREFLISGIQTACQHTKR